MTIKRANGHRNSRRQTGLLGPRWRESADRAINRMHARRQTGTQLGELRMQFGEKFFIWITTPFRVPHRLVAGGANASDKLVGMLRASERRGNKVGKFHPRMRGVENFRRSAEAMQQFAPEPFARIGAATLGKILRAHFFCERGDFRRFTDAGMVFPQPRQRGGMIRKFFLKHERLTVRIHRQWRAAGRIHADADDLVGAETFDIFPGGGKCLLDGDFRPGEIIRWMLPRQIGVARQNDALRAVRVSPHGGGHFRAVGDIDDERANRVCSVVQTNGVLSCHNFIGKLLAAAR